MKKYEVKKSPIHGKGVFATEAIKKNDSIGEYTGTRTQKDGIHVLWVWLDEKNYYGVKGNGDLRFLNHSSKPNAFFDGTSLFALKNIKVGEEITFHYGEDWKDVP